MNEIAKNDALTVPRKCDPREVLDVKKRTKICGLLALGYSRRMAAEHVGCDPSTITRTAKRDESFREQLAAAQSDADIEALKLIRRTADQEKYWRAAAWILERRNPDEYGRRAPNTFTGEEVMQILDRVLRTVMPSVPAEKVEAVMVEFEEELSDVAEKARLPLPAYDPPAEEDNDLAPIDPPRIATETKAEAASLSAPPLSAAMAAVLARHVVAPSIEPLARGNGAGLIETGKRASCLEQFVQREPKAATGNGKPR